MTAALPPFDPERDLVLERYLDVPPTLVWRAWTEPEQLKKWFCPRPWQTVECELDLRPGGTFFFALQGPEGERGEHTACILDVIPGEQLVWTTAMQSGFRPIAGVAVPPPFTAVISIVPEGNGTRYSARAMHADAIGAKTHAEMGFHEGWGAALDQLPEAAATM